MDIVGQEINIIIINVNSEDTPVYNVSSQSSKVLVEDKSLKLLQRSATFHNDLKCNKCSQSLNLNIFLGNDAELVGVKLESKSNTLGDCADVSPITKQDSEYDDHIEIFSPNVTDSESEVETTVSKIKRTRNDNSITKRKRCRSVKIDSKNQLWHQEWSNGDVITTNFDLECKTCDICNKPRGRTSTDEFLQHRSYHFIGLLTPTNDEEFTCYCLGCDQKFQAVQNLEVHSRTCPQKLKLSKKYQQTQKETVSKLKILNPEGIILPKLPDKKAGYFLEVLQPDGTMAYVEHAPYSRYTFVTNFNPRKRQCDICQQHTSNAKSLRAHRKLHFFQLVSDEVCVGCGETFKEVDQRTHHTLYCRKKNSINPKACAHCNHIARNFTKLRFHISTKHGPSKNQYKPSVMCHLCSKTVLKEHLGTHLLRHESSDGKAYECDECGKRFLSWTGIKEHLTRQHFPHLANYRCGICDFGTRTDHVFKQHLLNKHNIGKSPTEGLPCKICNQVLKTQAILKQHMINFHTNPKEKRKYTCEVCNKSFFKKYNLEKHSYQHIPDHEKPYKCKCCNKGFGDKHKLTQHEATHDPAASQLFCCPTCGKGMKYKQSLETHMRMHTGEQPYECQVCKKKFADRGNYRQHMKSHEKELGIKLTFTAEERRLMKLKLLEPQQLIGLDM